MAVVGIESLPPALRAAVVRALPAEPREALLREGVARLELCLGEPLRAELLGQAGADRRCVALAGRPLREVLDEAVLRALERCGGDRSRAARELGVSRSTVIGYAKRLRAPSQLEAPPEPLLPPIDKEIYLSLPGRSLRQLWEEAIRRAVRRHGGDKSAAARALGVSRSTVVVHCRG